MSEPGRTHDVVIAGGGPTGLMLAAELMIAGVRPVIVERRDSQQLEGSRAGGLHSRSLEVLEQRGVVGRFLDAGQTHPQVGFAGMFMDISDVPTRHPHLLALWQQQIEVILADWVLGDLAVEILRSREVVGLDQDDTGVDVWLADGSTMRTRYLVGCDGGRSVVRTAVGIEFPGTEPSTIAILGEVEMDEEPPIGMRPEGGGIGPRNPGSGDGLYGAVIIEPYVEPTSEPTLDDLKAALVRAYGTDFGVHSPRWITRFTDAARQASSYRSGRVLLAGDAAHIHSPHGGQGLNIGLQDAVNLGWKLAQVVQGVSPESLLDTYQAERHPVGATVLHNTMAQVALGASGPRAQALRDLMGELVVMDEPRRRLVGMLSGLDVHYDLGSEHPLVGRRMPDLELETADGPRRISELLHDAHPLFVDLTGTDRPAGAGLPDRVRSCTGTAEGPWQLPVIGEVAPPPAVLIRPDGYVAWAGDPTDPELAVETERWFGNRDG